jgi:hypothetical protein
VAGHGSSGGALEAFPDGDWGRAAQLGTAWKYFYGELDCQHHSEHKIAWPAPESVGVSRDLLAQMDAEHDGLATALSAADAAVTTLRAASTSANVQAARQAVSSLHEVAEQHLQHVEAELEPVYWGKHDTPEIKQMGRKFAKRKPLRSGDFFGWLQYGATPAEQASLRASVPAPVVAVFGKILGQRYRRTVAPAWAG